MGKNDPVLELTYGWKKVTYFGHELVVPEWVNWIAIDGSRMVYGYRSRPLHLNMRWWCMGESSLLLAALIPVGLDWRETLREV